MCRMIWIYAMNVADADMAYTQRLQSFPNNVALLASSCKAGQPEAETIFPYIFADRAHNQIACRKNLALRFSYAHQHATVNEILVVTPSRRLLGLFQNVILKQALILVLFRDRITVFLNFVHPQPQEKHSNAAQRFQLMQINIRLYYPNSDLPKLLLLTNIAMFCDLSRMNLQNIHASLFIRKWYLWNEWMGE